MHMKGRKHRLQFKKKVDPKLKVEMKPNNFKNKRNEKWKKQTEKPKEIRKKDFRLVLSSVSVFSFSHDDNIDDEFDEIRFDLVDLIL